MIENSSEVEKISFIKSLKKEFRSFGDDIGWRMDNSNDIYMTPSDAYDGHFLEAINTTMNILDKHYMRFIAK